MKGDKKRLYPKKRPPPQGADGGGVRTRRPLDGLLGLDRGGGGERGRGLAAGDDVLARAVGDRVGVGLFEELLFSLGGRILPHGVRHEPVEWAATDHALLELCTRIAVLAPGRGGFGALGEEGFELRHLEEVRLERTIRLLALHADLVSRDLLSGELHELEHPVTEAAQEAHLQIGVARELLVEVLAIGRRVLPAELREIRGCHHPERLIERLGRATLEEERFRMLQRDAVVRGEISEALHVDEDRKDLLVGELLESVANLGDVEMQPACQLLPSEFALPSLEEVDFRIGLRIEPAPDGVRRLDAGVLGVGFRIVDPETLQLRDGHRMTERRLVSTGVVENEFAREQSLDEQEDHAHRHDDDARTPDHQASDLVVVLELQ